MDKERLYSKIEVAEILFVSTGKLYYLLKEFTPTIIKNKCFYNYYQLELLKNNL